ncbi:MAG: esterase/lipase superfamily enzyme [Myxococcota bacterium]
MERLIKRWHSPSTGQEMGLARYGWWGKPVVFFPTGGGDFLDCERFLMVRALAPLIEAGRIKLYSVDSLSRSSWIDSNTPPAEKVAMQERYDAYLAQELFPFIVSDCEGCDEPAVATGSSIGGYLALAAAARHPELFDRMIGMSGTYQMTRRMGEYWSPEWYLHDPCQFLPNMHGGPEHQQLRDRSFFFLGRGRRFENPTYTENAAAALSAAGVAHRVEIWGGDSGHDWPTWRTMLPMALDRLVP